MRRRRSGIVPTQTDLLLAAAHGSAPITFDWGFGEGDPDLESRSSGNNAAGAFSAQEATPGIWFMAPALIGPFNGPASGTVDTGMAAHTRAFDTSVTSPPGDPQLADIDPNAAAAESGRRPSGPDGDDPGDDRRQRPAGVGHHRRSVRR